MKRLFFFTLILLFQQGLFAQLQDDFSDGNFSSNPEWFGATDQFTVNNGELQLNNANPESSNISILTVGAPTSLDATTTWEFFVRLEFSPSASNFARVYLNASNADLSASQNTYYVQVGGISGNADALELVRQDGTDKTVLISGVAGAVGENPALASVRITRSTSGDWELWADYTGGTDYQLQGTATDATYDFGNFFGIYCRYTSTRSEDMFFDNILINPLFEDTEAPQFIEAIALSEDEVEARFNEPMSTSSAEMGSNYTIDNGIGSPSEAEANTGDPSIIKLSLDAPLISGQTYTLTINNITDLAGNSSGAQSASFTYIEAQFAVADDIIISEIMADPSPEVGLPNAEFIELYNRSDKAIQIGGFGLSSGGSPQSLPAFLFLPGTYVLITDASIAANFESFGTVLPLDGFPALTNSGDGIRLVDDDGDLIHEVEYSDSWYKDEDKRQGGWTLELIMTDGPFNCGNNWIASQNPLGGTPATVNSVDGQSPEATIPDLLRVSTESDFEISLFFSESLDPESAFDPSNYSIDNGLTIANVFLQPPNNTQVLITLNQSLQNSIVYTVTVSSSVKDCLGNPVGMMNSGRFGLAEEVATGDIAINEVLFNPETGGKDFIELYNRSNKIINLFGMELVNTQKETGNTNQTIVSDYLLLPQDFALITSDAQDILARYTVLNPGALIENNIPTLEDQSGNITLRANQIVIDSFDYDEDFHFQLLDNKNGVSLERLDPFGPSQSAANWHTAAEAVGFATPTYQNSQFFENNLMSEEIFSFPKQTFSPDGDGFEDIFLINYAVEEPGYVLNLRIFDTRGRLVNHLINNELLASSGTFKWDGATNEGSKARLGIYVLWLELFRTDGVIERTQKTCVVAGRLE